MFKINPYRPGAGLMPAYIAGRDEDIKNVEQMFSALTLNIPTQSIIFSGLRGVGKTVLINKLQNIAEDLGIFCKHIEIEERNDFISQIAECSQAFLRKVSTKEKFKHLVQKPLEAIKSLVISFNPEDSTFSFSLQDRELYVEKSDAKFDRSFYDNRRNSAENGNSNLFLYRRNTIYETGSAWFPHSCVAQDKSAGLSGYDRWRRTSEDI